MATEQFQSASGNAVGDSPKLSAGVEWIIDVTGGSPLLLADAAEMRAICDDIVRRLELRVIGAPQWHQFPQPGGVTGLYLLSESHLACHTFPEWGLATFNLYCCRPRIGIDWEALLRERLCSASVSIRLAERGGCGP